MRNRGSFPPAPRRQPTHTALALKSGDRYAVSSMYHLLCRVLDRNGLPHSVLRKQLELEYGHHIEETQNATWIPGIRLFLSGGFAKEELHQAMESLGV